MSLKLKKGKMEEDESGSDTSSVLVSVEDLINIAMGPADGNTVNYKMLQTVLHILARQMRLLETKCDIKTTNLTKDFDSKTPEEAEKVSENKGKEKSPKSKRIKSEKTGKDKGRVSLSEKQIEDKISEDDTAVDQKEPDKKSAKYSEQETLEKITSVEKQLYLKQKEIEEKVMKDMTPEYKEQYLKQKEKELQELTELRPKERKKYLEEKEKELEALLKMSHDDRDKYFKDDLRKEEEALKKMTPKERKKYQREKKLKSSSGANIVITESERQSEKVLIVEKGSSTRVPSKSRTSIEVVTLSQFNMLQTQVEELKKTAAPLPIPSMPDDEKLKSDLVKGTASLTDTMQAMQVSARVQAAETGLERMAALLTQLAASGLLPDTFIDKIEDARAEMERLRGDFIPERDGKVESRMGMHKSVGINVVSKDTVQGSRTVGSRPSSREADTENAHRPSMAAAAIATSMPSSSSFGARKIAVTRNEMDEAIQSLRDEIGKNVHQMTYRAGSSAETAAGMARAVADKMEVAVKLNSRISDLYALTTDYADQLSGFDAGLATQMQSFQEQMSQMRGDLKTGVTTLAMASNNAETAAVLELTERYTGLENEMDSWNTEHQRLFTYQRQLAEDLRGLVGAVEMLREEKADRDEVWDGLRDKANVTKLAGLLTEAEFERERSDLDARLQVCYEKFNKQENVWMKVVKDLTEIADQKAKIMHLISVKEDAQKQLNAAQDKLKLLEIQLGEPKAAMLTRAMSVDGKCGSCKMSALIEAVDPTAGKPAPLPAARPAPPHEPCTPRLVCVFEDEDTKLHMCNRWVGGSHTLVSRSAPREVATAPLGPEQPVKRYAGYGADGKMYRMAEELMPCLECNKLSSEEVKGAGDADLGPCPCWGEIPNPAIYRNPKPDLDGEIDCSCK